MGPVAATNCAAVFGKFAGVRVETGVTSNLVQPDKQTVAVQKAKMPEYKFLLKRFIFFDLKV